MSPHPSPERDNTIDAIRTLACLGVIVCHAVSPFRTPEATGNAWLLANLLDTLSRPAVGVFFMLAGMFGLRQPPKLTCRFTMKFYGKKWRTSVFLLAAPLCMQRLNCQESFHRTKNICPAMVAIGYFSRRRKNETVG